MKVFIALGKAGDILSVLPIAFHHFNTTKQKPTMIVATQYASLLNRVPFVDPCVYPGEWSDLAGALKWAKQQFGEVSCLSTFGIPIEQRCSSFQLDAWDRGGMLKRWDRLPLEGMVRGTPRKFLKPTILFADHSQSSPFLQKNDLYALLKDNFPKHDVIRLSEHRVNHLVDFLDWYDGADALVTVETAHLHLSSATKTPVFALATDSPSRWHGSSWSRRFKFYCRYSQYDQRKMELVESIRDVIGNVKKPEVVEMN